MSRANWTDEQISAFLDGELDEAATEALARAVEADEALAARVERLGAANKAYVAAMSEIDRRPLSPGVEKILSAPPTAQVIQFRPKAIAGFLTEHRAIAASLLCAAAVWGLSSTLVSKSVDPMAPGPDGTILASSPIHNALEGGSTGEVVKVAAGTTVTPRLTFASADGNFCRQFEVSAPGGTTSAIACREGAAWRTQVAVFGGPRSNPNDFQTASGARSPALEAFIDQHISGAPLTAAEEMDAIREGWRK